MRYESDNYLVHHGIKGQHWGVRRFQNEDGTLTEAGKNRYLVGKECAEEHKRIKKEEIKRLEKKHPLVNRVNRQLQDLQDEYKLDDGGNPTWRTPRDRFTNDQIRQAQEQFHALRKITKYDRESIKDKAKEIATQKLIEKYGEESIKDMEYYHAENLRRDQKIGKIMLGFFAAMAAIPIIGLIVKKPIENYRREQASKNYIKEKNILMEAIRQHNNN